MRTAILIPARLESKRYPNKPLIELDGIPMIKRIFDICNQTDIKYPFYHWDSIKFN